MCVTNGGPVWYMDSLFSTWIYYFHTVFEFGRRMISRVVIHNVDESCLSFWYNMLTVSKVFWYKYISILFIFYLKNIYQFLEDFLLEMTNMIRPTMHDECYLRNLLIKIYYKVLNRHFKIFITKRFSLNYKIFSFKIKYSLFLLH